MGEILVGSPAKLFCLCYVLLLSAPLSMPAAGLNTVAPLILTLGVLERQIWKGML